MDDAAMCARLEALVRQLREQGHLRTHLFEEAFRRIPRHLFLPGFAIDDVYSDRAIIIKQERGRPVSSSSQPAVMAIMLEQLSPGPGHRVLEIGAGTGYNAALLGHVVGGSGLVVTVDIDEDLVSGARRSLHSAGVRNVEAICCDGWLGYASAAPYDRIIVTASAPDIPLAWVEQLKPDGVLLLPLAIRGLQKTVAFQKREGHLDSVSVESCGFMPLRGAHAMAEKHVQLGPNPALYAAVEDPSTIDSEAVYERLRNPGPFTPTGVRASLLDLYSKAGGLITRLAWREENSCWLYASSELADPSSFPCLLGEPGKLCYTLALIGESGVCALSRPPGDSPSPSPESVSAPFELCILSFGDDEALAARMLGHVTEWDKAEGELQVRAYPRDVPHVASEGESVVEREWNRFVVGRRRAVAQLNAASAESEPRRRRREEASQ